MLMSSSLQHLQQETAIQDFENLDFKKASGVRKLVTGRGKAQSGKSLISGKRIVWMSCDVSKIAGDNEVILDFRDK